MTVDRFGRSGGRHIYHVIVPLRLRLSSSKEVI